VFPIRDDNPSFLFPIATIAIIALNVIVWALVQGFGTEPALTASICRLGLIPGELFDAFASGTDAQLASRGSLVAAPRSDDRGSEEEFPCDQ